MRILGVFAVLVGVSLLVYYIVVYKPFSTIAEHPDMVALSPAGGAPVPVDENAGNERIPEVMLEWKFIPIEDGVSDVMNPQTDVAVSFEYERAGKVRHSGPHRLGVFTGSCNSYPESISGEGYPGAAGYALCWFAGFGEEVAIVPGESGITIYKRGVDEGSGEVSGEVGLWQKLFIVPLDS